MPVNDQSNRRPIDEMKDQCCHRNAWGDCRAEYPLPNERKDEEIHNEPENDPVAQALLKGCWLCNGDEH